MSLSLARRIGAALQVKSETRIRAIDSALLSYVRLTPQSPTTPSPGSIDASQIISGSVPNARISQASVVQHEAALTIDWMQLASIPSTFPPSAHNHAAADVTSGTFADARIAQSNVTQHQLAVMIAATQLVSGLLANARVQQSNVTQHQAALTIDWMQLSSVPSTFTPAAHVTNGSWTPADGSGAGLAISGSGTYSKHENIVIARGEITYPATADGNNAVISGLPFTVANSQPARQGFISYSNRGVGFYALPANNTQTVTFSELAGSAVTNAALSGKIVYFCAIYTT